MTLQFGRLRFIIFLLLAVCTMEVYAQEQKSKQKESLIPVIKSETYNQVLDLLFPCEVLTGSFGYAFVLRYEPSFNAESQITILNRAGKIQIVEYTSLDGNIYQKINDIYQRTGQNKAEELAKQIQVQKRVVNISPSEIKRLRESFYNSSHRVIEYEKNLIGENIKVVTLTDDGARYRLWYRGTGIIYYDLSGSDINSSSLINEHPMIKWMKNVRYMINRVARVDVNPWVREINNDCNRIATRITREITIAAMMR